MSTHFCQVSAPPSSLPLSTPVRFLLNNPLPLSAWTLNWKTNKELHTLWENRGSLKKTCLLYLFLVCLFIFQSLTQEDDDKMTFKCPLLSSRDHSEKDVHLQLNPLLPPLPTFVRIVANPLRLPRCRYPSWMAPYVFSQCFLSVF